MSTPNSITWPAVGAAIAAQVERWSGRKDVVVAVAPSIGRATALYRHDRSEIEVNADTCFPGLRPEQVGDLSDWRSRTAAPAGTGAVYHEAMHAKHSGPVLEHFVVEGNHDPNYDVIIALEEGRIETKGVRLNTGFRPYLRASALDIAFGERAKREAAEKAAAAAESGEEESEHDHNGGIGVTEEGNFQINVDQVMSLISARTAAKILKPTDLTTIREAVIEQIGQETHDRLYALAVEFAGLGDTDFDEMSRIAKEWRETLPKQEQAMEMSGDAADALVDEIMKQMGDAMKEVMAQARREREAAESNEKTRKIRDRKRKEKVFQEISSHTVDNTPTNSELVETRKPTRQEKAAMHAMARELDRARYRDRQVVRSTSAIPPGRLKMRNAMAASIARAQNRPTNIEPFRAVRRKHTDETTVTIGTIVDISGSMHGAMEDMASMSWIISNAVHQIEGDAATIYFGQSTFPTLFPGEKMEEVKVYSAEDGHEEFREASAGIDGALNLTYGTGARIVIVVSDGQYKHDERPAIEPWLQEMNLAGVAVVWMNYGYPNDHLKEVMGKLPMCHWLPMQEMVDKAKGNSLEVAAGIAGKVAVDLLSRWQG